MAEMTLRIRLEAPPAGVLFGIQKGRGSEYETILTQRSTGADLVFEFAVALGGGPPVPTGPLVHGPAGARFIYVDIGTYAGDTETQVARRLKVPLEGIAAPLPGAVFEVEVPGTGRDGGPACGSVKDFAGWRRVRRAG